MNTTTHDPLETLGHNYRRSRANQERARTALRDAVLAHAADGMPETQIAELAGIDRMTVRKWKAQYGLEKVK